LRKRASCLLFPILFLAFIHAARDCAATGLYIDLPSFFSAADSARTRMIVRQTECDLVASPASLLAAEVDFKIKRRHDMRLSCEFPAVRRPGDLAYGVGDAFVRIVSRISGDSLSMNGLFLRADARIPMGSKGLRPFSYASLEGGAGLEARLTRGASAVRGAALYTLVGERPDAGDFTNDHHLLLAVSLGASLRHAASVAVGACYVLFRNGDARQLYSVSLARELSRRLVLGIEGAVESGDRGERVFDSAVAISLSYRFPQRARAEKADSAESPVQNATVPRSNRSPL